MSQLANHLYELKFKVTHVSGAKLLLLFIISLAFFALYYTFVIPHHFVAQPSIIAHDLSLKEQRLAKELQQLFAKTIKQYSRHFILRLEDRAEVYAYPYDAPAPNTDASNNRTDQQSPVFAHITPETVQVHKVKVADGLIHFKLRLPTVHLVQQEAKLKPLLDCIVPLSASKTTDQQNDLIHCYPPNNHPLAPLTQIDVFYHPESPNIQPNPIIFSQLKSIMPTARNMALNSNGYLGRELAQLGPMLMLSTSIITTSGTMGMMPATSHARIMVAMESVTGLLIGLWYLAVRKSNDPTKYPL